MKKNERRDVLRALSMISQLGFCFITPIGICIAGGYFLDKKLGTNYWFIILFILGVLAAFRNAYQLTKTFYHKELVKEKQELEYWKNLRGNYKEKISDNKDKDGSYKE